MDNNVIYSPFNLSIASMEKLLLINIEKDPDKIYSGFEPQTFILEDNTEAIRILAYRLDGYTDIYQEKKLPKNEDEKLEVTGNGLGDFIHLDMEKNTFILNEYGIDAYFIFIDKLGRKISLKIKENLSKKIKPFSLLAPVGVSSIHPVTLPVFFLYGFYFVRQRNTDVIVRIGEKNHKLDPFIRMDGEKMYFCRYSSKSIIGEWNKSTNDYLYPLNVDNGKSKDNDIIYSIDNINDAYYIKSMELDGPLNGIKVRFEPSIKNIVDFNYNEETKGKFIISGHNSIGTIEGDYLISRVEDTINLQATPSKGWIPNEKRLILKLIYFFAKMFKNWPKTYKWVATVKLSDEENPRIESKWLRQ